MGRHVRRARPGREAGKSPPPVFSEKWSKQALTGYIFFEIGVLLFEFVSDFVILVSYFRFPALAAWSADGQ